ncbi:DNA topoisomerase III [Histoplasma capsulatum G186AR]|uniref:DNA topoisomerase n=2 Tax=Ajellomyces capsulatus TaxID=5037 RepID=C0NGZ5_AJECG|nr:DNA topoisomerase III [Histoplasma capsulatum G186AR]EEH09080.1 DNA topoisomerase III [Histoplasma capsulatum G186AR]KAG5303604.1 DNA topoisomerase III [Histoplasma capsulatum]QSS69201.1 DNA topoisomerase III [Histoplasma capsulatum G186AR]
MARKILCVAEKPAIARVVAQHLSGGSSRVVSIRGNVFVKNYEFDFTFAPPWGQCSVIMTSVIGHLTSLEFDSQYRGWNSCPPGRLFDAPVVDSVAKNNLTIAENIRTLARNSKALFIWTDCDREGEHIGTEVRYQARKSNPRIEIKRARFSNTERAHILQAATNPIDLDDSQANAVAARIELDLRIGAAFTRLQTLQLKSLGGVLEDRVISYGSCQFPTLGFVVDRYFRVKNFKPEKFWTIKVSHVRDGKTVNFLWRRVHLYDRAAVVILFERCLTSKTAKVTKVHKKPTRKWRPLPLTTVDLQMMGSRYLRMDSQKVMKIAETLYTKGFISYPRTETDQFDKGIDLKKLIEKQIPSENWGQYAQRLINGSFTQPRAGHHNDKAHPPIHPVIFAAPTVLSNDERLVYEFVTRRFLACCSEDAKGESTEVEIKYGDEIFHTHGLLVLERNYLDVYVYDKWESSQEIPPFTLGEVFEPTEAKIMDGKTVAPGYLTEPELIGLMDANGIGTDATMADHIARIKEREYVATRPRGGGRGNNAVQEFIPTQLGVALVEGYDNVVNGLPDSPSLSKPFLRKEMELRMREICVGTKSKTEVVNESLQMYREVFVHTQQRIDILKAACRKYIFEERGL